MARRVVVTGAGLLCPLGGSAAELRAARLEGRSALRLSERFGGDGLPRRPVGELAFDAAAQLGRERNLRPLDRISQMVTAAAARALADADLSGGPLQEAEAGLVLGTMFCGVRTIAEFDRRGLERGPTYVSPFDFANTVINAAAGQGAIWHGLDGLNSTLSAGPAAGLQALAYAADQLRAGRATTLLAGGADELSAESYAGFERAGWLCGSSGRECAVPFDARRDGFAPAEGAALLVLEEAAAAARRGARALAEVLGGGQAYDASRGADVASAAAATARAIRQALAEAGVEPDGIDAVGAGANGGPVTDRAEARALVVCLGPRAGSLPVTAVKAGLGEPLGAGGALQAVDALASLSDGLLPGVGGLQQLDPEAALSIEPTARRVAARRVLLTATGFDGSCAALVLGRCDAGGTPA